MIFSRIQNIPILMYHHVVPESGVAALSPYAVSNDLFVKQLDLLLEHGFQTVTLSELSSCLKKSAQSLASNRVVALTFDDCPVSLMEFAIPQLVIRNMKATFFAVAGRLGGKSDWDADLRMQVPLMTGSNLRSLAKEGFEIGSHCVNHVHLTLCSREDIAREISDSRSMLQDQVGESIDSLAYPFGEYPRNYEFFCKSAGYSGAVSIFSGSDSVTDDKYCMRRIIVHQADQSARFLFKLSAPYMYLRKYVDRRVISSRG